MKLKDWEREKSRFGQLNKRTVLVKKKSRRRSKMRMGEKED